MVHETSPACAPPHQPAPGAEHAREDFQVPRWIAQRGLLFAACRGACRAWADPAPGAPRVLPAGKVPSDARLAPLKDLNGEFPFHVPESVDKWQEARRGRPTADSGIARRLADARRKTPANAVIHGRIDRPEYTVERVYLESYPGHFVTGSLYRPKVQRASCPGVLFPHGHWQNGRFHDAGEKVVRKQIVEGAERFEAGGRSPLQSLCVQLARMGCVVFQYDMVGYADSKQISFELAHRYMQRRPQMETRRELGLLQPAGRAASASIMGLQTYNSRPRARLVSSRCRMSIPSGSASPAPAAAARRRSCCAALIRARPWPFRP